jgi:DNA polymerase-4
VPEVLEGLPVEKLWGIGKGIARRLQVLGIRTCGELAAASPAVLRSHFGLTGEHLYLMGQGIHTGEVLPEDAEEEVKSLGHSLTLPRDLSSLGEILPEVLKLSEMVGKRARQHGLQGRVVSLTVRYWSFETFQRRTRLESPTSDTRRIYRACRRILDEIRLKEPVRLLGVTLSGLVEGRDQPLLFREEERRRRLLQCMDALNQRFGSSTLTWAGCLLTSRHPGVISPAWRPSGIRRSI